MNERDIPDRMRGKTEVVRWADSAMYHSAELPADNRAPGGGARPTVRLLNATPDPLGSLAALCGIYEGKVVRSLAELSDDDRRAAWEAMRSTVLNGPLESIQFHFLIEGVTRAQTHQAVRNRFSFIGQESLRFAVVDDEDWLERQAYPPSLSVSPSIDDVLLGRREYTPEELAYAERRMKWNKAVKEAQWAYQDLVAAGVPAEEARGLMPHAITTRYHWVVSIRTLLGEAGKRLTTQAQFEWRYVMAQVVKAIREYQPPDYRRNQAGNSYENGDARWQFELFADSLRPICYQTGKCEFLAKFDRHCTIRDRVQAHHERGEHPSTWADIRDEEWLADPSAARLKP